MDHLKVALAEDAAADRENLENYLEMYAAEKGITVVIRSFPDGKDLVESYEKGTDLVLLDIDMIRMDGMTAAKRIREMDERVQIVFITRMVQHALEGYEVQAADYVIKPVLPALFMKKLDRILRRITFINEDRKIALKTAQGQQIVGIREIRYAETTGRSVRLHLSEEREGQSDILLSQPLYQLAAMLPETSFFRCHNAILVNLDYVTGYSPTDVFLGKEHLPLSKHRKRAFVEALTAYYARRG